jgi:hypothetical protein
VTIEGGAKVISAKRSKLMSDRWSDPAKGPDGLTFRERRQKAARDQRERELQTRKGDAPKKAEGDPAPTPSSPGAEPGHPPTPPAKSERRGYTAGRAWR